MKTCPLEDKFCEYKFNPPTICNLSYLSLFHIINSLIDCFANGFQRSYQHGNQKISKVSIIRGRHHSHDFTVKNAVMTGFASSFRIFIPENKFCNHILFSTQFNTRDFSVSFFGKIILAIQRVFLFSFSQKVPISQSSKTQQMILPFIVAWQTSPLR